MVSSCPSLPGRSAKSRRPEWRETFCFKEWSEKMILRRNCCSVNINFLSECRLTVYLGFFINFKMSEFQFISSCELSGKGAMQ